jgi:hypothetical protein
MGKGTSGTKEGVRILAIASGAINREHAAGRRDVLLVGVVQRQQIVEGIVSGKITTDGNDSSKEIIRVARGTRFVEQIRIIALNGIALAGLNIAEPSRIEKALGVKMVIVTRTRPRQGKLIMAIKNSKCTAEEKSRRIKILKTENMKLETRMVNGICVQYRKGATLSKDIIQSSFEAIRLAHLIARGISTGESKGRI